MTLTEVVSCQSANKSSGDPYHSQDHWVSKLQKQISFPYGPTQHTNTSHFLLLNILMSINENHTETHIDFIQNA